MNIKHLNIGILHSLIGKNDGVSIVIDQSVNAMVNDMGVQLGNIYFLAAHTSPRFNADTDEIFWHKNQIHKRIIEYFSQKAPPMLEQEIHSNALYAKKVIANFIEKHEIDLLIAHNTSHPYNFITAVGLGYYLDELRDKGVIWPKVITWWHDSYLERERFKNPNPVIKKHLKYLPGLKNDGIVFINQEQPKAARKLYQTLEMPKLDTFFERRCITIPNTSNIPWNWQACNWDSDQVVAPETDNYNASFFEDIGLTEEVKKHNCSLEDTVVLLQHTRVVPRKKIELAIDFAFLLEKRFSNVQRNQCVALLISGHSGDEQVEYKTFLQSYFDQKTKEKPRARVVLIFAEDWVLSHRDIIVDKKYYKFAEIPAIVANAGGIGTYFSEVEGYGNNLLEMVSFGLPAFINKYEIYKTDIEHLGFDFPAINDGILTNEIVEKAYVVLNDNRVRNQMVRHNLNILQEKLDHRIISKKLNPLIKRTFTQAL